MKVARVTGATRGERVSHSGEFLFLFVLDGSATLEAEGHAAEKLGAGDALTIPAKLAHSLTACSPDLQLLEVALPAEIPS